jgi:anti-sigma B factor antagonist
MQLNVTPRADSWHVETSGAIDDTARDLFREELHPRLLTNNARMVLDLSGSNYVNSQGLGHLVTLASHANTKGAVLVFCGLQPHVAGVVAVTKLDRFFTIVPDAEQAFARLTG